jgi:HEAT repeat protein
MNETGRHTRTTFFTEVEKLREWIESVPMEKRTSEWETLYEDWPRLTKAFCDFLDFNTHKDLDERATELILYALDKDDEDEAIMWELKQRPFYLLKLADAGLQLGGRNARWQLAAALADMPKNNQRAEDLLELYFNDDDEYVRRRALLALGHRGSSKAESFAYKAWDSGEEYARIAALEVLDSIGSPTLQTYLALAKGDGRKHLVARADVISAKGDLTDL